MNFIATKAANSLHLERILILLCLLIGNVHHQGALADTELKKSESPVQIELNEHELNGIKVFSPTHDWQVIAPGEIVFAGLHYRINVATGLKEAKLMDENDGSEYYRLLKKWIQERQGGTLPPDTGGGFKITQEFQVSKKLFTEKQVLEEAKKSSSLNDDQEKSVMSSLDDSHSKIYGLTHVPNHEFGQPKNLKIFSSQDDDKKSFIEDIMKLDDSHASFDEQISDFLKSSARELQDSDKRSSGETPSKFRTYEQLKQELADLELLIDDEQNVMQTMIKKHQSLSALSELIKSAEDMEYLLHNIDNAQVFIDHGGLQKVVLPALNSSSPELRVHACRLVTACVQNFPKGQIAAFEAGLLTRLLAILQSNQTTPVYIRTLSSVSGMVRQFPLAQAELIRIGLPVLRSLLRHPVLTLKAKVTALLSDLLLERIEDSGTSERVQQLIAVGLERALLELDWCHHLTKNLRQTADAILGKGDQDLEGFLDTLLHALDASVSLCPVELRSTLSTLQDLELTFRNEADSVTSLDKAELYEETANSILGLISSFIADSSRTKVEL